MGRRWIAGLALAILLLPVSAVRADAAVRYIVLLQSFDRGTLVLDQFTALLRGIVDQRAGEPVVFTEFTVSPPGFRDVPDEAILDFLASAYAGRPKPDLVITTGGTAASFARSHRQRLFPGSPLLYTAVDARFFENAVLALNEAAVVVSNDHQLIFEDMRQLFPETSNILMVLGSGELGRFWRREFDSAGDRLRGLNFEWVDGMSYAQILQRAATLPPHSAIYFLSLDVDAQGSTYSTERVLGDLRARANAPVFGAQSAELGHGLMGGHLMSTETVAKNAAEAALRILAGTSPSLIKIPVQRPGPPIFDWRELQRWGVSEARLPPGSEVRFRGPSLWQDYRREVLGVSVALLAQALLIVGLLYQRRARHRAEIESRRNLALAADANRRATISALGVSLAHELGQPLNSILHNAQAAEMLVNADRATPDSLREILADIRTADVRASEIIERHRTMLQNRELDTKPIDIHAIVRDSLALVAHDSSRRQVQVDAYLPTIPCVVNGDQILLQQVVVNLIINATDAMADTPTDRRRIAVSSVVGQGSVKLSVRDSGTGLPAGLDRSLFQPFVTTKANGLGIGLTIVRTIVDAHGGRIDAHNNPTGGATFTVTLPCSER